MQQKKLTFMHFLLALVLVSIIESGLVLGGFIPPISTYSPGNLIFIFLKLILIVISAVYFYKLGVKKCTVNGAILGLVTSFIVALLSFIGKGYGKPVLGLNVPGNYYWLMIGFIVLQNVILGAVVAALSCWIARKIKHN